MLHHVVVAVNACHQAAINSLPFYAMFGRIYCLDIPRLRENDKRTFDALSHGMDLDASMVKIHRLVKLCAEDTDF